MDKKIFLLPAKTDEILTLFLFTFEKNFNIRHMQILKTLSLLLLLINSNLAVAFDIPVQGEKEFAETISLEFVGDQAEFSDGSLTGTFSLPGIKILSSGTFSFKFSRLYAGALSKHYVSVSGLIVPSLGIPEIIFPFHSFL